MGKRAILGLGYQMGAPKFKKTCWDWAKVEVDLHFAKQVVRIYRNRYDKVVNFWKEINDVAIQTVELKKQPHKCILGDYKGVAFKYKSPFLHLYLPSGRKLSYKDPSLYLGKFDNVSLRYMGVNSVTRKWSRIDTYGGKLTENIVQAIARDIMAEGMLRAEAAGYPIVLTVHDEVIAETTLDKSVEEFVDLLTEVPEWAKGCPIDAEGWKGKRYRK
jgi:DNA polymerase